MSSIKVINGTGSPVEVSLLFSAGASCHLKSVEKYSTEVIEVNPSVEGVPECVELIEPSMLACIQNMDELWQTDRLLACGQVLRFPVKFYFGDNRKMFCQLEIRRLVA